MKEDLLNRPSGQERMTRFQWIVLSLLTLLYIAVRLPWIGHLITWDEAMNLLTVRSLVTHGQDYYSSWFWRHPPLAPVLMMLAKPLQAGFAERSELLMLGIGVLNLLVLFAVTRQTVGLLPALWAAFFYAVMPAARFYDLWLKPDSPVVLFGVLSILFYLRGRPLISGVFMGLAFLSKEMAVFYAGGLCLLWLIGGERKQKGRELLLVAVVTVAVSAWWFFGFSTTMKYFVAFVTDSSTQETDVWQWARPWHYFLSRLPVDLGWTGVLLCLAGMITLWILYRKRQVEASALWAVKVLIVGYLLMSLSRGKGTWWNICLFPLFAVVQGIGAYGLVLALHQIREVGNPVRTAAFRVLLAAVAALFVLNVYHTDYEAYLCLQDKPLWWGTTASREMAQACNQRVRPDDRLLITPMYYWEDPKPKPCPIFAYYLDDVGVLVRPGDINVSNFVDAVRQYKINWAMVSPMPGVGEKALIEPLIRDYGLQPILLRGGCIFKTDRLCQDASTE